MTIEGHDDARAPELHGALPDLGDDCAVAEVHAVVGADGDDASSVVVARSCALGVTDDLHGDLRYRFGKHDARFGGVATVFVHRDES